MTSKNRGYRIGAVATICVVAFLLGGTGAVATGTTSAGSTTENGVMAAPNPYGQEGTDISIRNLSAPDEIQIGTSFTVTAEIVNRGDAQDIRRVSYRIAGNVIEFRPVLIPANDAETVRFDVAASDIGGFSPGTYTHGVFAGDARATTNLTLTEATETPTPEETPEETVDEETPTPTVAEATSEEEETPTSEETPTPELTGPNVTFENQTSNGSTVSVESVNVPRGGFVVIHDRRVIEGEAVGSIVGESDFLEAGTHRNVTVELDEPLNESQRLVAVAYRDTNDDQEFDFVSSNRTADGPYTKQDSREAVNEIAFVTLEEEEEQ